MSNGPPRPKQQPFRLVDPSEEGESYTHRISDVVETPAELTQPWQRRLLGTLETIQTDVHGLKETQEKLVIGQQELTVAFGNLVPRIKDLEKKAQVVTQWRRWGVRAQKAAIPLVSAIVGHYAPALAKHLPSLLEILKAAPLE